MFHGQSWHSSVVSSSLASDHPPLRSFFDERMIWGFYAICSLPGRLIDLDSLKDKDQCLQLMVQRLHRCNRDATSTFLQTWKWCGSTFLSCLNLSEWRRQGFKKWVDWRFTVFLSRKWWCGNGSGTHKRINLFLLFYRDFKLTSK